MIIRCLNWGSYDRQRIPKIHLITLDDLATDLVKSVVLGALSIVRGHWLASQIRHARRVLIVLHRRVASLVSHRTMGMMMHRTLLSRHRIVLLLCSFISQMHIALQSLCLVSS